MKTRGFTLVELVMVIMITGVLAASLTIFLKPAVDSYFAAKRRADLTDMADTALRRMGQDIRRAVPNSIVSLNGSTCFELVPTITGGRYRMAADTVNGNSAAIDTRTTTTSFDVLSQMTTTPSPNDWVVIDNQNGADVYSGIDSAQIASVTTPAVTAGQSRITLAATAQFSPGYDGGRFLVVSNNQQAVVYSCPGDGTLYRTVIPFGTPTAASCAAGGQVVATDVAGCEFVYDPNHGATQQSGFLWMRLELSRSGSGESVALAHGAHVDNVP
ncbi:MAG: type II secretion system protein [Rhodocyclaceae bacterium]|nr:type II secretion system protein [Rhodocyclaceae bacterium]